MALDDAGRSRGVVDPHRVSERPHALGMAEARRRGHQGELDEWHGGLLDEDARRLAAWRSEEHTSELQSRLHLVCRLLLEKKKRLASAYVRPRMARTVHGRPNTG